ncbi:hypothetical protein HNQ07_000390 [Deinococcus metalli]|uniref:Phage holin family protein n=1 Tax=Deinococcus metalli TaxID=1141878 RepID=A0A7W8NMQ6_9DEIO|nr:phage holin family protein [Deinococcus metalli]MBB5374946.1 hypothetical protein [Deinococcus metalli]GHF32536.1 hypothetical protein GCM10017781_06530 [Deinococcus metalli]
MEERKSMGSALVDVFDAGVTLVKSEINGVARKVGDIAKAKGIGVVLLLAAVGPLVMALIFLILAVFYALIRLGAGPWFAALIIAVLSLAVTGALIFLGLKRLGAEVKTEEPLIRRSAMSDDSHDQPTPSTPHRAGPASAPDDTTPQARKVELRRDAQNHAAGETRVTAEHAGHATVRVEGGETTVPVYESQPDGTPAMYGSGLNEKIEGKDHDSPSQKDPAAPRAQPGIPVSTDPTFQDDMRRGHNS